MNDEITPVGDVPRRLSKNSLAAVTNIAGKTDLTKWAVAIVLSVISSVFAGVQAVGSMAERVAEKRVSVQSEQMEVWKEAFIEHKAESRIVHAAQGEEIRGIREDIRAAYRFNKTGRPERILEVMPPVVVPVKEPSGRPDGG